MINELLSELSAVWVLLTQFTGCIAVGLCLSFLFRRSAARAHQILLVGVLTSILLPVLYLCVQSAGLGLFPTQAPISSAFGSDSQTLAKAQSFHVSSPDSESHSSSTFPDVQAEEPAGAPGIGPIFRRLNLRLCWVLVSLAMLARLLSQLILGLRILAGSRPVTASHLCEALAAAKLKMDVTAPVNLHSSNRLRSPAIWCWWRIPVLLVHNDAGRPNACSDWEGVFCHELAHFRRFDQVSGLAAELLTVLFPWQPLVWFVRRRLLYLSELACDDWVLAAGQSRTEYAETLLSLSVQKRIAFLPAIMGKEHKMKKRIRRIVAGRVGNPIVNQRWTRLVVALTLCASVGVSLAQRRPLNVEDHLQRQATREAHAKGAARIGRQNVLNRLLDQLHVTLQGTEVALHKALDEPAERRHILRSELETLRQQIAHLEEQVSAIEPARPDRYAELEIQEHQPHELRDGLGAVSNEKRHLGEVQRPLESQSETERLNGLSEAELRVISEQQHRIRVHMQQAEERFARIRNATNEDLQKLEEMRADIAILVANLKKEKQSLADSKIRVKQEEYENLKVMAAVVGKMKPDNAADMLADMSNRPADPGVGSRPGIDEAALYIFLMDAKQQPKVLDALIGGKNPTVAADLIKRIKSIEIEPRAIGDPGAAESRQFGPAQHDALPGSASY